MQAGVDAFGKWTGWNRLQILERRYFDGDRFALLKAVEECLTCGFKPPEWVSSSFRYRLLRIEWGEVVSLDDAFGSPYPKGTHVKGLDERFRLQRNVHRMVSTLRNRKPGDRAERALDDGLFEEVGEAFGIGKTKAKKLYYDECARNDEWMAQFRPQNS